MNTPNPSQAGQPGALSTQSMSEKIAGKIDQAQTGTLAVSETGKLTFANLNQIMEVAKVVAIAKQAIPPHLRDNVGACLAVCIQASEWEMSPFSVANKSYLVNDRMAYEAQLIAAVILRRAPIAGRLHYEFEGEGPAMRCIVSCKLKDDGSIVKYRSPEISKIPVKNSPLWRNDPEQQLGYYSARALARRHFPDVLLGVYTADEMAEEITNANMRDVAPIPQRPAIEDTPPALPPAASPQPEKQPTTPEPEQKPAPTGKPEDPEAARMALFNAVEELRSKSGLTLTAFKQRLGELQITDGKPMLSKLSAETLQTIKDRWEEVANPIAKPAEKRLADEPPQPGEAHDSQRETMPENPAD